MNNEKTKCRSASTTKGREHHLEGEKQHIAEKRGKLSPETKESKQRQEAEMREKGRKKRVQGVGQRGGGEGILGLPVAV